MLTTLKFLTPMLRALDIAPFAIPAVMARLVNMSLLFSDTFSVPLIPQQPVIDYELSRAYPEVWKAMEHLVDNGKVKSIGALMTLQKPPCQA